MIQETAITLLEGERPASYLLTVIVPIYNEDAVLDLFHRRLVAALSAMSCEHEIIYIDDGSCDKSRQMLAERHAADSTVGVLRLSRNFGKEQAISAGLHYAGGDAVVVIDADLQDPPELISSMTQAWQAGADVVNMRRLSRKGESWFKRATAHAFYRVINRLSDVTIHEDVGDFRLLSRRSVDALNKMPERCRFMKGLFSWIGFQQVTLDYNRDARAAGTSKWRYWQLWNLALEGITSFSTVPLKLASYVGFVSAMGSFFYGVYFFLKTLAIGDTVSGFPTLIIAVLFLGGLQLMALGILGEYLSRLFIEVKNRPLFLIDTYSPAKSVRLKVRGDLP